jgi:hypothetical protein
VGETATPPAPRARIDISGTFPRREGESRESWTERLTREAAKSGVYRQCSIGWHEDCSQRRKPGPDCPCNCSCHVEEGWEALVVPGNSQSAPEAPAAVGEQYLRKAQAAAIREWVRTSRAELEQAQLVGGIEGNHFYRGILSALKNASRRADDIEAGTHTVDSDHQEIQR